jgi:hypothetical protein
MQKIRSCIVWFVSGVIELYKNRRAQIHFIGHQREVEDINWLKAKIIHFKFPRFHFANLESRE